MRSLILYLRIEEYPMNVNYNKVKCNLISFEHQVNWRGQKIRYRLYIICVYTHLYLYVYIYIRCTMSVTILKTKVVGIHNISLISDPPSFYPKL